MSQSTQITLASSGNGRIVLHLVTLWNDGKVMWHLKGILREFGFSRMHGHSRTIVCS